MAAGAVGGVELLAVFNIAGLQHFRRELGEQGVLLLRFGTLEVVDDGVGAFGNGRVGMRPQPMLPGGSQLEQVHLLGGEQIQEGSGGVRALHNLTEGGFDHVSR